MKSAYKKRQKRSYQIAERAGKLAEFLILLCYLCRGFWPIARRYRTPFGEIDLIMRRRNHIRFIEVKYRTSYHLADSPVTKTQLARLRRAATATYHKFSPEGRDDCQFDIVVYRPLFHIHHFYNHIDMSQ